MFARVMHAEDGSTLSLSRNSEFPNLGYGFGVISITPGSRDFLRVRRVGCGKGENAPKTIRAGLRREVSMARVREARISRKTGKTRARNANRPTFGVVGLLV
jgi:hypothetical protein